MRPPVTARQALYVIMALMLLSGVNVALMMSRPSALQFVLFAVFSVLLSFFPFLWYVRDRDARGYVRSIWLNMCMVSLTPLAMPYYLIRSRPRGQKLRAFFWFVGFVLLCLVGHFVGEMIGVVLSGKP